MSVHAEVDVLSDAELRAILEKHNVPVGPIVASTRALYRKKLLRILCGSNEIDETLQDSVGGYEASMESSDHEEFLKQEAENSARARHRLRSWEGSSYSRNLRREPIVNKSNKGSSKAVTIQLYLIVILMVAILCLSVYLYLSWNTASRYDAYDAIEAAAKAALKKTNQ